jgi:hypothetical protein
VGSLRADIGASMAQGLVRSGSLADIEAHLRRPALTLSADITEHDLHVRFVPKVISATFASVLHE